MISFGFASSRGFAKAVLSNSADSAYHHDPSWCLVVIVFASQEGITAVLPMNNFHRNRKYWVLLDISTPGKRRFLLVSLRPEATCNGSESVAWKLFCRVRNGELLMAVDCAVMIWNPLPAVCWHCHRIFDSLVIAYSLEIRGIMVFSEARGIFSVSLEFCTSSQWFIIEADAWLPFGSCSEYAVGIPTITSRYLRRHIGGISSIAFSDAWTVIVNIGGPHHVKRRARYRLPWQALQFSTYSLFATKSHRSLWFDVYPTINLFSYPSFFIHRRFGSLMILTLTLA